MNEPLCLHANN